MKDHTEFVIEIVSIHKYVHFVDSRKQVTHAVAG